MKSIKGISSHHIHTFETVNVYVGCINIRVTKPCRNSLYVASTCKQEGGRSVSQAVEFKVSDSVSFEELRKDYNMNYD